MVISAVLSFCAAVPARGGIGMVALLGGAAVTLEEEPVSDRSRVQLPAVQVDLQLVDSGTPFVVLLGGTWGRGTSDTRLGGFTTQVGYLDAALGFSIVRRPQGYARIGAGGSALVSPHTTVNGSEVAAGRQMQSHIGLLLLATAGIQLSDRLGLELGARHREFKEDQVHGDYVDFYSLGGMAYTLGVAFRCAGP
jgi:hypothetical protein